MELRTSVNGKKYFEPSFFVPELDLPDLNEKFLIKAFNIIERNLHDSNFNVKKFSKEIGISRAHLHRKLKELTNQSATEFIRTIRLKFAAGMLNKNAASVSEIAYLSGFNNLSYFSRCFKKEYGVVPSAFFVKTDLYNSLSITK